MICKECGKEISNTLKSCPNCGYENKKEKLLIFIIMGIGILIAFISLFIFINTNNNLQDYMEVYSSESKGNIAYLLNRLQIGSIPLCTIAILVCIGMKNKYKQATLTRNILIGLLVLCQVIPMIYRSIA